MTQFASVTWPEVVADVRLFPTDEGGKTIPILSGYRCPCVVSETSREGWDVLVDVGEEPFHPGTSRRVRLRFLTPEGREAIVSARSFFLREARIVGEATVVGGDAEVSPSLTALDVADVDPSLLADLAGDTDGVAFFGAPVEGATHGQR